MKGTHRQATVTLRTDDLRIHPRDRLFIVLAIAYSKVLCREQRTAEDSGTSTVPLQGVFAWYPTFPLGRDWDGFMQRYR
jgi:hypothetical protein